MNKIITGKCVSLSSEGKGIIKLDKEVIFVDSLLLGEEAEVEITYSRAGVSYGVIKKLLSFSKDRITPKCPIATACGGCSFQNATYEYELKYKQNKVKDAFRRHLGKEFDILPTIGMDEPYHYRNKIQVPIGRDPHGHIVSGFYRSGTHSHYWSGYRFGTLERGYHCQTPHCY